MNNQIKTKERSNKMKVMFAMSYSYSYFFTSTDLRELLNQRLIMLKYNS